MAANAERICALGHALPSESALSSIRESGFCHEISGSIAGIVGVAVPIRTPKNRVIAALAIGATEARLPPERLNEVVRMMTNEVKTIEAKISATSDAMLI